MLGLHPPGAPQELFSPHPLPHPWLVSIATSTLTVAEVILPSGQFQQTCSRSNYIHPSTKSKDNFQRSTQFKITHDSITKMLITYLSPRTKYAALGCVHHNYKVFLTAPAVRLTNSISFNMNLALLISGKLHLC